MEYLRFILVTPDEVILPELNRKVGSYAQRKLAARGVEIITHTGVSAMADGVVELTNGHKIPANTLIWTAGAAPNPLLAGLPLPQHNGRIAVDECLAVEGWPGLWAVGDRASVSNPKGGFYPPTAQHALREGAVVARNVAATLYGRPKKKPFRYTSLGQLAAIGRRTGVGNILGVNFSGFLAWWLWRTFYLSKLPRLEKKVRLAMDWTLDLSFTKDFACVTTPRARAGARLLLSLERSQRQCAPSLPSRTAAPRRVPPRDYRSLSLIAEDADGASVERQISSGSGGSPSQRAASTRRICP